mmetsp:Transcript_108120/g.187658  ORF Transcript_108120/g.187658 Transcript_108120/m.187658 type:complete len:1584 (-) Transcript_108120:39-4790(-)
MPVQGKAEPCCFSDFENARCQFQVVRSPIRNVMRNIQASMKDGPVRSQSCQQPTTLTNMRPPARSASNEKRPPQHSNANENRPPPQFLNSQSPAHGQKPTADNFQDATKKSQVRSPVLPQRGQQPPHHFGQQPPILPFMELPEDPGWSRSSPNVRFVDQHHPEQALVNKSPSGNQGALDRAQQAVVARLRSEAEAEASRAAELQSELSQFTEAANKAFDAEASAAYAEASRAAELQSELAQCNASVNNAKQCAAIAERKVHYLEMDLNAFKASAETNRQDAVSKTIQANEQEQDLQHAQAVIQFQTQEIETLVSGHEHMHQQLELQKQDAEATKRTLQAIKESVALCEPTGSVLDLSTKFKAQEDTTLQFQRQEQWELCMEEERQQHAVHVEELQQQSAAQLRAAQQVSEEVVHELRRQVAEAKEAKAAIEDEAWQQLDAKDQELQQLHEARMEAWQAMETALEAKDHELQQLNEAHAEALRSDEDSLKARLLRVEAAEDACQERAEILQEKEALLKQSRDDELCHLEARLEEQSQHHAALLAELQQQNVAQAVEQADELMQQLAHAKEELQQCSDMRAELHEQSDELQRCRKSSEAAAESAQQALSAEASSWEARLDWQGEVHAEQMLQLYQAKDALEEELNCKLLAKDQELQLLQDAHSDAVNCQDETLRAKLLRLEAAEDACLERSEILQEKETSFKKCREEVVAVREMCHELGVREEEAMKKAKEMEFTLNSESQIVEELRRSHQMLEENVSQLQEEKQKALRDSAQLWESSMEEEKQQHATLLEELRKQLADAKEAKAAADDEALRHEDEVLQAKLLRVEAAEDACQERAAILQEKEAMLKQHKDEELCSLEARMEEQAQQHAAHVAELEQQSAAKMDAQEKELMQQLTNAKEELQLCSNLCAQFQEQSDELQRCREACQAAEESAQQTLSDQVATWEARLEQQKEVHSEQLKQLTQASAATEEELNEKLLAKEQELRLLQDAHSDAVHCQDETSKAQLLKLKAAEDACLERSETLKEKELAIKKCEEEVVAMREKCQELEVREEAAVNRANELNIALNNESKTVEELRLGQQKMEESMSQAQEENDKKLQERVDELRAHAEWLETESDALRAELSASKDAKQECDSTVAQLEERVQELITRLEEKDSTHASKLSEQEGALHESWQRRLAEAEEALKEEHHSAVTKFEERVHELVTSLDNMESAHASKLSEQAGALNESWQGRLDEAERAKDELKKERDSTVAQLEDRQTELIARIRALESSHAVQLAAWQQQQDKAHSGEVEEFREQCRELMETVNQFRQQQESLMMENKSLKENLSLFEDDLEKVSDRHAQLIGHVNPKQKIRYTLKLKDEKNELRSELNKTRSRLAQLECARRSESLFEALASLGYGSVHGPVGGSPQPVPARRHQHSTPPRVVGHGLLSPEHSISSRTPRRNARSLRGGASVGGESDTGDHRLYLSERQCQMQERTLERLTTDFQHIVALIEKAVVADEASTGVVGRAPGSNFALLLQRLRSLGTARTANSSIKSSSDEATAPNTPNTKQALCSPRGDRLEEEPSAQGEQLEEELSGHEPEAEI